MLGIWVPLQRLQCYNDQWSYLGASESQRYGTPDLQSFLQNYTCLYHASLVHTTEVIMTVTRAGHGGYNELCAPVLGVHSEQKELYGCTILQIIPLQC